MGWHPECPRNPLPYSGSQVWGTKISIVCHRTVGHWAGDYAVLSRSFVPSVHFLIGENDGEWVQFYDSGRYLAHCANANTDGVGIEWSGVNTGNTFPPLTEWQIEAGGKVVRWLMAEHGIVNDFIDRFHPRFLGHHGTWNHSNVAGNDHWDYIDRSDYDRLLLEEDDLYTDWDRAVVVQNNRLLKQVKGLVKDDDEDERRRDKKLFELVAHGQGLTPEEAKELLS